MTATLFLSDSITAYKDRGGKTLTADSLFARRGKLRGSADAALRGLGAEGEVVACLPPFATSSKSLRVRASIGRRITHTDIARALEAGIGKSGGRGLAVVSAEPLCAMVDGEPVEGSAVGRSGQVLEVDVATFLGELRFLFDLEKAAEKAGLTLKGVMAFEEAAAAALPPAEGATPPLVVVDRWHTKLIGFAGEHASVSFVFPIGAGHLVADVAVTFNKSDADAEKIVARILSGRTGWEEREMSHVVEARLEELVIRAAGAGRSANIDLRDGVLVGLPATEKVKSAFAPHGGMLQGPPAPLERADPPLLGFLSGAVALAEGAVPRSDAAALQLSERREESGIFTWMRRNF